MTRINVVPVASLVRQHLLAEHYELPDVFKLVRRHIRAGRTLDDVRDRIPETYRLGTGHISFFINKLNYLRMRHYDLKQEMLRRGYNVSDLSCITFRYPEIGDEWYGDYTPTADATLINQARITERLRTMRKS